MGKVRVAAFSVSLDGFGAGARQDLENPLGVGMKEAFGWLFPTDAFAKMHGEGEGSLGIDNDFALRSFENVGAWILGRNMFGPVRGPWPDESWQGWWGEEPPYHVPTFVLTHYARPPLEMKGGTTFHFVTEGADVALARAKEAAKGKDVRIGGGVSTVRNYVAARAIDELHLATSAVLVGEGEALFAGMDWSQLGYRVTKRVAGENATHVVIERS